MTGEDWVLNRIFDVGGVLTSDDIIPKTIIYQVPTGHIAEIFMTQDFNAGSNGGIGVWVRKDGVEYQFLSTSNDFGAPVVNQSTGSITLEQGDAIFAGLSATPINIGSFADINYLGTIFESKFPF